MLEIGRETVYGEAADSLVAEAGRRTGEGGDEVSLRKDTAADSMGNLIVLAGVLLLADPDGALYWPEQGLLAVADLHLEKGSSFAARGQLLPPYDTAATLARLVRLIARYAPRCVVALGDSFHDGGGPARLADSNRELIRAMQHGREWIWIAGNHDPEPADGVGGVFEATLQSAPLTFRHLRAARPARSPGICIRSRASPTRPRGVPALLCRRRPRMVMPAFGAFTGGLNVRDAAFAASVRHARLHRASARRGPALCLRRQALPGGTNPSGTPRWRSSR